MRVRQSKSYQRGLFAGAVLKTGGYQKFWICAVFLLCSSFLGLSLPVVSEALVLNNASNLSSNSAGLSWSQSTSQSFARYEVYQSLQPITDSQAGAVAVPTMSEWSLIILCGLLFLATIYFLRKQRIAAIVLFIAMSSASGLALVTLTPIFTTTNITVTSCTASGLQADTVYYFRAAAFDANGAYELSNEITARTLAGVGTAPVISSFSATPGSITNGSSSTLSWTITNATSASINNGVGTVNATSGSISVSPTATTTYTLTATGAAGSVTAQATVTVTPVTLPVIGSFSANPVSITSGGSSTLSWTITNATSASINNGVGTVNATSGSISVSPTATTTYTLTAIGTAGSATALATVTVASAPPTFVPCALAVTGGTTDFASATACLYTGSNPTQTGVSSGTMDTKKVAVLRGKVTTRDNSPLSGVTISILNHPEFGQTQSRADGMFDLAANGGGLLTIKYEKSGYLPAQRQVTAPWLDYVWAPEVVMIQVDSKFTVISPNASVMQVAQGNTVTDADGTRQATLLFPPGTTASMVMPDSSTQPLASLNVRATEYTVGPNGPKAMPAALPPTSGYTYAVEFSADEARTAGAVSVQFSQPIYSYVNNFLGFPIGGTVPVGFYDQQKGQWVASQNGKVIKVLSITAGLADLDTDGDGLADNAATLTALNITTEERQKLASLYTAGVSLWRIPLTHFSRPDYNWPFGPPSDATAPGQKMPKPLLSCPNMASGSIIGCESQTLGEVIPVTGASFSLHYNSERSGALDSYTLPISLSGSTVPASLKRIELEVMIAGQRFTRSFTNAVNQSYTFTWDGKDAYGRLIQGSQNALVRIGYVYPATYQKPADLAQSFNSISGSPITSNRDSLEITSWQEYTTGLGIMGNQTLGLGGWSLSVHHVYDAANKTLYFGDGTKTSSSDLKNNNIITTVAGGGTDYESVVGPATQAWLFNPGWVAISPDNSFYLSDRQRVRRVGTDGIITTVAGADTSGYSGDGGPATQAKLWSPQGLALSPDKSLYIADKDNHRIRKIGPDGTITTVAGTGTAGYSGDGGPAAQAQLNSPRDVALSTDGSLYIADGNNDRVRRIGPDGIITTVAGAGTYGYSGDGGPAAQATLHGPHGLAIDTDNSLYIADTYNNRVRRVGPDGIITTVAGADTSGYSGDGGPATQATLSWPEGVAIGTNNSLYIADTSNYRVRKIEPDGVITTVAGGGTSVDSGDGGPATQARLKPEGLVIGPDKSLYIGDIGLARIRKLSGLIPGMYLGDTAHASGDGSELYIFNSAGRHLRTLDTLTNAVRWQFSYDSAGRLTSLTDVDGNITTISRAANGNPTEIIAPGGQRTALALDANGYLSGLANPANESYNLTYSSGGLLLTLTDPKGSLHRFTYNAMGKLTKDENPAGGSTTLARTEITNGYTVTTTTALGRTRSYTVEYLTTGETRRTTTDSNGAQTIGVIGTDGSLTITYPDGTVVAQTVGPDPRFGMQAPVVTKLTVKTPGGITGTITKSRTATLADAANILSLQTLTETTKANGQVFTSVYDATTRTNTATTPVGDTSTTTLDAKGRIVSITPAAGLLPANATYNSKGLITAFTRGDQALTLTYDAKNRLTGQSNAAAQTFSYAYDNADRANSVTSPAGSLYNFSYDANGNNTQLMMPNAALHTFTYNNIDFATGYTPFNNAGSYAWSYNPDRAVTAYTLPGGRTVSYTYDAGGRATGSSYPEAADTYTYDAKGRLSSLAHTPTGGSAQQMAFTYDGSMLTAMNHTGPATGRFSYTFDNNFRVTGLNLVSGSDSVATAMTYNNDGRLTGYGPFTLTRGGAGGSVSSITDTAMNLALTYDTQGRLSSRTHIVNQLPAYKEDFTYDNVGRISQKTETTAGTAHTYAYTYDAEGRLSKVTKDNAPAEAYTYDANDNRLSAPAGAATYDAQDRLISSAGTAYTFNADGFMTQRGADAFQYSAIGELTQAVVGGQTITYTYDGLGRRVSRTSGGLTEQYLYGNPKNPYEVTAARDTAGVLTRYYYDPAGNLISLQRGAGRYYVATDQLGTPRVVTDALGAAIKTMTYDSFGRQLSDSNPAFDLPLGFAGGIRDTVTGLTRFGFRDYDPAAGRWTAKDPILFAGGDTNLYVYVGNNPVNWIDPFGLKIVVIGNKGLYKQAVEYLMRDPGMAAIIKHLKASKQTYAVVLINNGDDGYYPNTKTITWDPHSALCVGGGTQSPALGLGHEMSHADVSSDWGQTLWEPIPAYGNFEEMRVIVGPETAAAKTLGEGTRTNHRGKPYWVPTSVSR